MTMHPSERAAFLALVALGLTGITVSARSPATRKPPRLPRAGPIVLQVGDLVSVGGNTYQVGYSLVPIGTAPTPIPTPPPAPATISGIRNRTTGALVTSATAGTPLQLEGTGLGSGGRLQLGGRLVALPSSWTDTAISFTAPDPGPTALTGNWDLYWQVGSNWTLKASTGPFTMQPQGSPLPTPLPLPTGSEPEARSLTDMSGAPVKAVQVGVSYQLTGDQFGSKPGRLSLNAEPTPVTQWTDGKILFLAPANYGAGVGLWVTVRRADGAMTSTKIR